MCSFSAHQSLADPMWEVYSPSSVGDHARRHILRLPANWQRQGSALFNTGGHNSSNTRSATISGVPARHKGPISSSGASSRVAQDCSPPRRSTAPTPPTHPAPSDTRLLAQDSSAKQTRLPVPLLGCLRVASTPVLISHMSLTSQYNARHARRAPLFTRHTAPGSRSP